MSTNSRRIVSDTLLQVSEHGDAVWLAYIDADDRIWCYLPNTGLFHHNPGLFQDFFFDREFDYEPVSPTTAQRLIQQRVGERTSPNDATLSLLAHQETRDPADVVRGYQPQ